MPATFTPYLMFQNQQAEPAMAFYVETFGGRVLEPQRRGPGPDGSEVAVGPAKLQLGELTIMCFDSPVPHAFDFTPSTSTFVEATSEEEIRRWYGALMEGGEALMPLDNYGFSTLFAWVKDRFGVSWQLNLR